MYVPPYEIFYLLFLFLFSIQPCCLYNNLENLAVALVLQTWSVGEWIYKWHSIKKAIPQFSGLHIGVCGCTMVAQQLMQKANKMGLLEFNFMFDLIFKNQGYTSCMSLAWAQFLDSPT